MNVLLNTLRPRQNGRHLANGFFGLIFLNAMFEILFKILSKFIQRRPINNMYVFDRIMAWRRPGDKPLSEPMMVYLTDA